MFFNYNLSTPKAMAKGYKFKARIKKKFKALRTRDLTKGNSETTKIRLVFDKCTKTDLLNH